MHKWPKKLETQIAGLDLQHKKLVTKLDQLCEIIKAQNFDKDSVNELLNQLTEDEKHYFLDEKRLIQEVNANEKLETFQNMKHCSFVYDIEKMRNYFSPEVDIMEPEKSETAPSLQVLETVLKVRHQYDNRNVHFKQQLAKCVIEQELTDCLHKNITTHLK